MHRKRIVAAAVVSIVIVAVLASVELKLGPFEDKGTSCANSSQSRCFYQQPVVDIILPIIGSVGNSSNPNRLVNLTLGSSAKLEVDVYPTVDLNVTMSFTAYLVTETATSTSGATPGIPAASFEPTQLSIPANGRGVTQMSLMVPDSTRAGTYAAVITATDQANSSVTWGLLFELNLT